MGSIMDKVKEMEEHEEAQRRNKVPAVIGPRFLQLYAAALTGVIAHVDSDKHSDKELVEQAYNLATLAYNKVR